MSTLTQKASEVIKRLFSRSGISKVFLNSLEITAIKEKNVINLRLQNLKILLHQRYH